MRKVDELRNVIANQFACEYKAYDLGGESVMHMELNQMLDWNQCIASGYMY